MRRHTLVLVVGLAALGVALAGDLPVANSTTDIDFDRGTSSAGVARNKWYLLREVTGDDTPLTPATATWTTASTTFLRLPVSWRKISLAAYAYGDGDGGGDPNDGWFSAKVYVCRQYSSAQLLAEAERVTIGELQLSHDPTDGDALTVSNEDFKWAEGSFAFDYGRPPWHSLGNDDGIGIAQFDTVDEYALWVEITNLTNISTLYVLVTGR